MDQILLGAVLVVLGLALLLLIASIWREGKERKRTRSEYLSRCRPLFKEFREATTDYGFTRLSGYCNNFRLDIQALPDTLTFRKLPALWVLVTIPEPMPVEATFDLVVRPSGFEPFSLFHTLPEQIRPPSGFPYDCAIRTDKPDSIPHEHLIRRHLVAFDDPRVKELVISPKGLRLVLLAEEAERSRYLVYRDSEMGRTPLPEHEVRTLFKRLVDLKRDLEEAVGTIKEQDA